MNPVTSVFTSARTRVLVTAIAAIAAGFGTFVLVGSNDSNDRGDLGDDIERRRSFYDEFPQYPGSVTVSEEEYEIKSDGQPTGEFGLTVVYRLPTDATSTIVSDFFRENAPVGWAIADDRSCATRIAGFAVPPPDPNWTGPTQPVVPPDDWILTHERSRLTVLSPPGTDIDSGITFMLSRVGPDKFVTLDQAGFSCAPVPEADTMADQFDQP